MGWAAPSFRALAIFPLVALLAAIPYVAIQYRRRGTVGAGHLLLAGAFALYLVALTFYVILPLRPVTANFCDVYGVHAQWNPFHLLQEARYDRAVGGWRAVLGNADIQQFFLNIVLFVPLGMFVRHLFRRRIAATIAIGFAVSLLIELTQLTGDWGIYPCAYRFFETNDLFTNTLGTAIGALAAPMLRGVPAQLRLRHPEEPQAVTPLRRMLAGLCDALAVLVSGLFLLALAGVVLEATRGQLFESQSVRAQVLRAATLFAIPGVTLLLIVPLAWRGRTIGEWAVLLRPLGPRGEPPVPMAIIGRFLAGPAPILVLAIAGTLHSNAAWFVLAAVALAQIYALTKTPTDESGAHTRYGLLIVDSRTTDGPPPEPPPEYFQRSSEYSTKGSPEPPTRL